MCYIYEYHDFGRSLDVLRALSTLKPKAAWMLL